MCIVIVKIWFEIVNGQVLLIFSPAHNRSLFAFTDDTYSNYQWIFTKFGVCIDIMEIYFGNADWQILSIFDFQSSARDTLAFYTPLHNSGRVLWFHVGCPWVSVRPFFVSGW